MKIINTHLIFTVQSYPSRPLIEVIETDEGYYFYKSASGYMQIPAESFLKAKEYTKKVMPDLHVEYSQERLKSGKVKSL